MKSLFNTVIQLGAHIQAAFMFVLFSVYFMVNRLPLQENMIKQTMYRTFNPGFTRLSLASTDSRLRYDTLAI